eukprot:6194635-Pleurochrysis_carterae.AAC.1
MRDSHADARYTFAWDLPCTLRGAPRHSRERRAVATQARAAPPLTANVVRSDLRHGRELPGGRAPTE